jgi:hypothetical protein
MSQNILIQYLAWHFKDNLSAIFQAFKNCLKFNLNFWSVPVLLKTWFSPWRRYQASYGKGFGITKYFEAFTFNMTSRVIGFVMRTFLIVLGLMSEAVIFWAGLAVVLAWIVLPLFLLLIIIYGFKMVF